MFPVWFVIWIWCD